MASPSVVIEVSPSRLELAVVSAGRVRCTLTQRLDNSDHGERWPALLATLDETLAAWVKKEKLRGARATVVYTGKNETTTIHSCPSAAGRTGAAHAARLALADAAGFSLDENAASVSLLSAPGESRGADGLTSAQMLSLLAADTEESVSGIADWIVRAGLCVEGIVPAAAVESLAAIEDARGAHGPEVRVLLRVGEHGSVLAASVGGKIRFVRAVGLGAEGLVESLTRPVALPDGSEITLTADRARALLYREGIPERSRVIDDVTGLTGAGVLPALAPALQRCGVEIKQSLRFGLPDAERSGAALSVAGFGALIPHLDSVIAGQCGLTAARGGPAPAGEATSSEAGAIAATISLGQVPSNLLPRGLERSRAASSLTKALVAGAVLGACVIAYDGLRARLALAEESANLAAAEARLAGDRPAKLLKEQVVGGSAIIAGAEARMEKVLGTPPDWAALGGAIARVTPPSIKLSAIEFIDDGRSLSCRIRGSARAEGGADANGGITSYLDALGRLPLVSSVRLGPTERLVGETTDARRFMMDISPVGLPFWAAAASEGGPLP